MADQISEENKIMMMLVRIGDENVEKIDSHIEKLCSHLCSKIEVLGKFISDTLLKCLSNIPNKTFIYAYVLYTMAAEEHENVTEIVKEVFALLNQKISQGSDATLLMKFFGALADTGYLSVNVFEAMIKELLEIHAKVVEENKENDYFLNLALVGYFFGRRPVRENTQEGSKPEIEIVLERFIQSRPVSKDEYNVFKSVTFDSEISMFWNTIMLSYKDNILLESKIYDVYLRPSRKYREEVAEKSTYQIIELPAFSTLSKAPFYKSPGCFELFSSKCLSSEHCDKGSYTISRDLIRSTMLAFQGNPFFACQKLCSFSTVPMLPYLIFDVIFDELFRLPNSSKKTIYYSSI
jgi:hypothetical protein